jgi:hypothetical protein
MVRKGCLRHDAETELPRREEQHPEIDAAIARSIGSTLTIAVNEERMWRTDKALIFSRLPRRGCAVAFRGARALVELPSDLAAAVVRDIAVSCGKVTLGGPAVPASASTTSAGGECSGSCVAENAALDRTHGAVFGAGSWPA